MFGAGCCALSAALAMRMRAGREGRVTSDCLVMIASSSFNRAW